MSSICTIWTDESKLYSNYFSFWLKYSCFVTSLLVDFSTFLKTSVNKAEFTKVAKHVAGQDHWNSTANQSENANGVFNILTQYTGRQLQWFQSGTVISLHRINIKFRILLQFNLLVVWFMRTVWIKFGESFNNLTVKNFKFNTESVWWTLTWETKT